MIYIMRYNAHLVNITLGLFMFKGNFISNITAGFVTVMVGFTSSVAIIFQAALAAGATPAELSSWLLALGIGMGITCIGLSLYYRMPILTAWSTPGAALLVTGLSGIPMSEAIGAFMFSALLITFAGATGVFERFMVHIPRSLTSAMLAGVLLKFGTNVFTAMQQQCFLVCILFLAYLIGKRVFPRFVIPLILVLGILIANLQGLLHFDNFHFALSTPVFTMPVFTLSTLVGIGIPLFVVTMTSQNVPGIAVMNASGYRPPISPLISWTGIINGLLAPFGGFSLNLAAITAAICMGKEADPNPEKRYKAAVYAGIFYLITGLFGATVIALFSALPKELVLAIGGLALLSTLGNGLKTAVENESQREPALITFLVSASGFSLFGIGAAFWGLIAGLISLMILHPNKKSYLFLFLPRAN